MLHAMRFLAAVAVFAAMSSSVVAAPVETAVEAPGPLGPLRGTMLAPADAKGPVVLVIPGSGPTDRDGNNPLGLKAATYRLLAEGLAEKGITSVRVDKRGMFGSAEAISDGNAVTIADYAADVRTWIASMRKATGAPCVWVIGHSEGALVALAAAQAPPPGLCGLVLVAGPGRSLGEILRAQFRANPANAPILEQAMTILDALEAGKTIDVSKFHPVLQQMFYPGVQGFLIDEYSYDPAKLIARYAGPVLVLQGERDIQIDVLDAKLLKAANERARLVLLPDTNHVLKTVTSDDRAANVATYGDPSLPLAPGVVDAVAGFVTAGAH
jgi:pimeloyl-ACP methyl ester carboxylesterase